MKTIFRRPTPAMGIALVALFVALSGTAVALPGKNRVDSNDPKRGSIGTRAIANNSVRSSDIRRSNVFSSDVKNDALLGEDVKDDTLKGTDVDEGTFGQVPSANSANNVGPNGVNTAAIQNEAVTSAKLGPVTQRQASVVVADAGANGGTDAATSPCLAGEQLLSGGAVWSGTFTAAEAEQLHLVHSRPDGTNWLGRGWNNTGANRTLIVRALCLG